jgi:hypothetical protein
MNKTLDLTMEVIEHKPVTKRRRRIWLWIGLVALVVTPAVYLTIPRPCGCAIPPMPPPKPCCAQVIAPNPVVPVVP